jgi:hypothetical protein
LLLKCWGVFSFGGGRLLLYGSLEVLHGGLGINILQFDENFIFSTVQFYKFQILKSLS